MARVEWFNTPSTATPLSAAMLNDLEARKPEVDQLPVNAADYGFAAAAAAGVNATALSSALSALPSTGGRIVLPKGVFNVNSLPSMSAKRNVIWEGQGSAFEFGGYGTTIIYTGTSSPAWNWADAIGCHLEGVQLLYNNASFTGTLVDLTKVSSDARYCTFKDCMFAGNGVATAAVLVRPKNAHSINFEKCGFLSADVGVQGKTINGDFSNAISFRNCLFYYNVSAHAKNAGEAWLFDGCTFEPLVDGSAGAYRHDSGVLVKGLSYRDCWLGDVSVGTGGQIHFGGTGLVVSGGLLGSEGASSRHVVIDENSCVAIVIQGVHIKGAGSPAVDFGATTGHAGVMIGPNKYENVAAVTAGTVPAGAIVFDASGILSSDLTSVAAATFNNALGHQVQINHVAGAPAVLFGSSSDFAIKRVNANQGHINGSLGMDAIAAASVGNNTLFRDTADNKVKWKDNAGVVNALY